MAWMAQLLVLVLPVCGALLMNDARRREIAGIDTAIDSGKPWRSQYAIDREYLPVIAGLVLMAAVLGVGIAAG